MPGKIEGNFTLQEAARWRQVSLNAIRALVSAGRLPGATKQAGRWFIPIEELQNFYKCVDARRRKRVKKQRF